MVHDRHDLRAGAARGDVVDDAAHQAAGAGRDELLPGEVAGTDRDVVLDRSARGGDDHERLVLDVQNVQPGRLHGGGAAQQPQFARPAADQGQHLVGGEGGLGAHRHRRMQLGEAVDEGRQRFDAGRGHGGDLDRAAVQPGERGGGVPYGRQVAQHAPARLQQLLAGLAQHDAPAHPVEEGHPEVGLQVRHRLGQRGLGDMQGGGGLAEAAVLDDGKEVLQLPGVHGASPLRPGATGEPTWRFPFSPVPPVPPVRVGARRARARTARAAARTSRCRARTPGR